jgi:hypothetical protein
LATCFKYNDLVAASRGHPRTRMTLR